MNYHNWLRMKPDGSIKLIDYDLSGIGSKFADLAYYGQVSLINFNYTTKMPTIKYKEYPQGEKLDLLIDAYLEALGDQIGKPLDFEKTKEE